MPIRTSSRRTMGILNQYHSTGDAGLAAYAPPASGMVLYLKAGFPGSGTTWTDQSGNGLDGTLQNGASWGTNEVTLDGVNDYISVADNALLRGMDGVSLLVWARKDTLDIKMLGKWGSGGNQYFFCERSGTLQFNLRAGGSDSSISGYEGLSGLHFYAAVYDGSNMMIYRDGALVVGPTSKSGTVESSGGSTLYFGVEYDATESQGGGIARALIYDRGLSAGEILAIHEGFPLT